MKILGTQFKPFLLPAQVVHRTDQHRGLLHSLWGLGMVALTTTPLSLWTGWAPVVVLLLGYTSHLMGDAATKSGIRLFYASKVRFHLLPSPLRLTTGSSAENAMLPFWALGVISLLLTHLPFLS